MAAVCTRNKMARAFALGDALGDRDLPRLLRRLDEELWEVKDGLETVRDRVALRFDFQGSRDIAVERDAARRLDTKPCPRAQDSLNELVRAMALLSR